MRGFVPSTTGKDVVYRYQIQQTKQSNTKNLYRLSLANRLFVIGQLIRLGHEATD